MVTAAMPRLRFDAEFDLGDGSNAFTDIVRLSKTKEEQAARIARKLVKELRNEHDGVCNKDWLLEASYEEASSICGNSQYDDGIGEDRWFRLREEIERLVIAAVKAEMGVQ